MAKYHAFGAKLQYNDGTGNWRDIAGVKDISGPSMSSDTIDVTSHSSPDNFREFRSSLKDPGEFSFDLIFDPEDITGQGFLLDLFDSQDLTAFRLIYRTLNSKTWQMNGLVTSFEPSNPVEGEIGASCTIKLTGKTLFETSYQKTIPFDGLSTVGNLTIVTLGLTAADTSALTGGSFVINDVPYTIDALDTPAEVLSFTDGTSLVLGSIDDTAETITVTVTL